MPTIMDLLNESAGGQFMAQMARQFAISPERVNAGMAALMPAFSEGFRRSAADPMAFFKLMQMFAQSQQAGLAQAFDPAGIEKGNEILGQIFGTKELSRAVAAQAAQAAGLSQTILKAMLPALAPAILGGLFKTLTGFQQGQTASAGANPFGQILEQMMGGQKTGGAGGQNPFGRMFEEMMGQWQTPGRRDPEQAPSGEGQNPWGQNPWGRIFEEMLGQGKTGAGRSQTGLGDNPLGKMFEEMLGGGASRNDGSTGSARQSRDAKPTGSGGLEDMIGGMFETGKTMQKDYQRNMESIFDEFLGGMKKG